MGAVDSRKQEKSYCESGDKPVFWKMRTHIVVAGGE
jgi:hypothetical protein